MDQFPYQAVIVAAFYLSENYLQIAFSVIIVSLFLNGLWLCRALFHYLYLRVWLPGPRGTFLMGNLEQMTAELTNYEDTKNGYWKRMNQRYKSIYRVVMGHQVYVVLQDPNTIATILRNSTPKASGMLQLLYPWLGDGILTNQRQDWSRSRKILYPMFSHTALQDYLEEFNESADTLTSIWSRLPNMKVVPLGEYTRRYSLEVLVNCIFHRKRKIQVKPETTVLDYMHKLGEIQRALVERFFNPAHQFDFIYSRVPKGRKFSRDVQDANKFLSSLILENQNFKQGKLFTSAINKDRNNIIEMLLQATDETGKKLSDKVLHDEINNLLFSGFEPTAISLQYVLYCLAANQEHQELCRHEVLTGMRGRRDIDWSDLANFHFLTKCIRESLRLFSPTGALSRQIDSSTVIDGIWLPAGTNLMLNVWQLHEDPAIWQDPHTFNPYRFKGNDVDKKSFFYLPFSGGDRNCIGQHFALVEMKVLLAKILINYRIKLPPGFEMRRFNRYFIVPTEEVRIQLRRM